MPFSRKLHVAALIIVLLVLLLLNAQAAGSDPCYDELLMRWNEFAHDANQHVQTIDADAKRREKTHSKLNREWEALNAMACW